jgi:hypothetical protein
MLRSGLHTFVLALAAVVQPLTASAQEEPCGGVRCRAIGSFRTCDKPLDGAKILSARVLATSRECSNSILSNIVSVQVENGKANNLPDVIEVSLGPCAYFHGDVGDIIKVALRERHSPDVRRYQLACRIW